MSGLNPRYGTVVERTFTDAAPSKFTIIPGEEWDFEIAERPDGEFPSRLAALENQIASLEEQRTMLAFAIAKAKRLRRTRKDW